MVLLDDSQYACRTCIKGHRSSTCKHADRPLFRIQKKGRPATVCHHCRELRKRKQVHVRCKCGPGELRVGNQSPGVDSSCLCPTGGDFCDCCTPRKSASRRRRKGASLSENNRSSSASTGTTPHLAELHNAPSYDLSNELPPRHSDDREQSDDVYARHLSLVVPTEASLPPTDDEIIQSVLEAVTSTPLSVPPPPVVETHMSASSSSSICGCTDACSCPGCDHHSPHPSQPGTTSTISSTSPSSFCNDPSTCKTCLHCSIFSLPASLPHVTQSLPIFDHGPQAVTDLDTIDEWIRQVSSLQCAAEPGVLDPFDGGSATVGHW